MNNVFFDFISAKLLAILGWFSFIAYIVWGKFFIGDTPEVVPFVWQYLLCSTFYVCGLVVIFIFACIEFIYRKKQIIPPLRSKLKFKVFFEIGYYLLMSPILGLLFLKFKTSFVAFVIFAVICIFFKFLFFMTNK